MFYYSVPAAHAQDLRDEAYHRMSIEGLLPYAMSALANPTLDDWRRLSDPAHCWMLRCEHSATGELCGVGLFTPWRGRVWEFDFTAYRPAFAYAVAMARGAFAWIFAHAPCDSIMGLCPTFNRHAWKLANACGFQVLGRVPGACYSARHGRYVDAVFVIVTPQTLTS